MGGRCCERDDRARAASGRDRGALVRQLTHRDSDIIHAAFEQAYESGFEDLPRRLPDISKIERLIGYRPTLDLTEMLGRIVRHMRAAGAATKAPVASPPPARVLAERL